MEDCKYTLKSRIEVDERLIRSKYVFHSISKICSFPKDPLAMHGVIDRPHRTPTGARLEEATSIQHDERLVHRDRRHLLRAT